MFGAPTPLSEAELAMGRWAWDTSDLYAAAQSYGFRGLSLTLSVRGHVQGER
jgi:hypothetical protein